MQCLIFLRTEAALKPRMGFGCPPNVYTFPPPAPPPPPPAATPAPAASDAALLPIPSPPAATVETAPAATSLPCCEWAGKLARGCAESKALFRRESGDATGTFLAEKVEGQKVFTSNKKIGDWLSNALLVVPFLFGVRGTHHDCCRYYFYQLPYFFNKKKTIVSC